MTQGRSLALAGLLLVGAGALFTYSRLNPPAPAPVADTPVVETPAEPTPEPARAEVAKQAEETRPPPAFAPSQRAPATVRHDIPEPPPRRLRSEVPTSPPPELPDYLRNNPPPMKLPEGLPKPEELREHFLLLRRFLELPPERLARIRQSIERIERMPPDRKQMMLERIRDVNFPAPGTTEETATKVDPALRARADAAIASLPAEAQQKIRSRIAELPASELVGFLEGIALQHELAGSLEDRLFGAPAGE